jgi:hypothetical protein
VGKRLFAGEAEPYNVERSLRALVSPVPLRESDHVLGQKRHEYHAVRTKIVRMRTAFPAVAALPRGELPARAK